MIQAYILIQAVSSCAVCIVKALNDLRPKRIATVGDVKASTLVERRLVGWDGCLVPREAFGTDAGQCRIVSVLDL